MTIRSRPFAMNDLAGLYRFLGEARQQVKQAHILHMGDLTWQVFHMLVGYDPSDLLRLWEDETGKLLGFALAYPRFGGFDLQVRGDARDAKLERAMFEWARAQITALNPREDFYTLANEHDQMRLDLLEANGFQRMGDWLYMQKSLDELPAPPVPDGFHLSDMTHISAAARAQALAAAFGASPLPDRYERLLSAPGYDPHLDVVAVDAQGQVAAFALCWQDAVSREGEFEPVGTVPAFQRLGLGKAVLLEGMRRLHQRGMQSVIVVVDAAEEPACQLYRSVGLETRWKLYWYGKTALSEEAGGDS